MLAFSTVAVASPVGEYHHEYHAEGSHGHALPDSASDIVSDSDTTSDSGHVLHDICHATVAIVDLPFHPFLNELPAAQMNPLAADLILLSQAYLPYRPPIS